MGQIDKFLKKKVTIKNEFYFRIIIFLLCLITLIGIVILIHFFQTSRSAVINTSALEANNMGEINASSFEGNNIGEKINNAVAALKGGKGTILVNVEGEINETILLNVGQSLKFGNGKWICNASPTIVIDDASQITGNGVFLTKLSLGKTSAGPIIQSKDYEALCDKTETEILKTNYPIEGDGNAKGAPGVKYIKIKDLTLFGNKENNENTVNGLEIYGFWFSIENVSIEHFSGNGMVTQFIPGASVDIKGNDAMESYFTNIKLLSNNKTGWVLKGPHDPVISGLIVATNGEWGVDVLHKENVYSGGGAMFSNTHIYGNGNGLRTESGANILAYGIESEANRGVGILLRSNDSVIHGIVYANETYGLQIGDKDYSSGVNLLNIQSHNNKIAQVYWANSAGYNILNGAIFPNDEKQKLYENRPTKADKTSISGPGQ